MKKMTSLLLLLVAYSSIYAQYSSAVPQTWEIDSWDDNNWNLAFKTTNTFNEDCYPIVSLQEIDLGAGLVNAALITTSYNSNNQPISEVTQLWDSLSNSWINFIREDYTYANGVIIEELNLVWEINDWQASQKRTLTYAGSEDLLLQALTQDWDSSSNTWENNEREVYSYEVYSCSVFFIASIEFQDWNGVNWENYEREVYSYGNCLLATLEFHYWNGLNWENDNIKVYSYDENGFLIEVDDNDWNGVTYQADSRVLITNNSDGNPTELISQDWEDNNTWLNTSRGRGSYSCLPLGIAEGNVLEAVDIYPNPAFNNVYILTSRTLNVVIYDSNGRELQTQTITQEFNSIDVSNLSNGVYILKLVSNKSVRTQKLVVKR